MRRWPFWLLALTACSGSVDSDPAPSAEANVDFSRDGGEISSPTWWQDVEPIVRRECQLCHASTPVFGAPMPLVDYADVRAAAHSDGAREVHALVAERIVPNSGLPPMPPVANGSLTDDEILLIRQWSAAGAPEGQRPAMGADAGVAPDAGADVDAGEPDAGGPPNPEEPYTFLDVVAPDAVVRPGAEDRYGCFRTVVRTDRPLHAVEIAPELDEISVLHHILLFRDGGRNYPEAREGLLCAADTVFQDDWELLHGWAPGGGPMVLPPEAGVLLEDGDHLVIQIHYNNPSGEMKLDRSGMRLRVTETLRPNDAAVLAVGTERFNLPPGEPAVQRSGDCELPEDMVIFQHSPHMHLLGAGARLERIRDGQTELLADVPEFAFEGQAVYPANWTMRAGDTLRATCTWDTTSRTRTTNFGEGTSDEMCYVFVAHYPPFGRYSCGNVR